jgi:hypothetical protein
VLEGKHLFVEAGIIGLGSPEKAPAAPSPREEARAATP